MQEERFTITREEMDFLIKRRQLMANVQQAQRPQPQQNQQLDSKGEVAKDAILGANRPKDWDCHDDVTKPHKGRLTQNHPFYRFEEEIFKKITNMQHRDQHRMIKVLFDVHAQNIYRDRVYHALSHLDALWQQEMLPLKYKIWYENFKLEHNIGADNVHPAHKVERPDYNHPIIENKKRPWDAALYSCIDPETEEFQVGKKYRYSHDDEVGYDFKTAYAEELKGF